MAKTLGVLLLLSVSTSFSGDDSVNQDITYVSARFGSDSPDCGTLESPCHTISYGIIRAQSESHSEIQVDMGTYTETITMVDGISIAGGFDANDNWLYGESNWTVIMGNSARGDRRTIIAEDIQSPTHIKWFRGPTGGIIGQDNNDPSGNTFAIYVVNSPGLEIIENDIVAGNAGPGGDGLDGANGQDGVPGGGGETDPDYEAYETSLSPCEDHRQHNNGGILLCSGTDVRGGRGGGNDCPPIGGSGLMGETGAGPGGGMGGAGGGDGERSMGVCIEPAGDGAHGSMGQAGNNGSSGPGAVDGEGTVIGTNWGGYYGEAGQNGSHGYGGGGGGGGGGVLGTPGIANDYLGGHGGGGGSGGCGGEAGDGGQAGGGSFGVFIVSGGAPAIQNNNITLGNGGPGGRGGMGGFGGTGGMGGHGGGCDGDCGCVGSGGNGGNGGNGGHGGGGGGGAGGVSYGIYAWGITNGDNLCEPVNANSFTLVAAAQGGLGGSSAGSSGLDGPPGAVGECIVLNSGNAFICGDANSDHNVNVGDAVFIINYVFKGGAAPDPLCVGDANGDSDTNVGDAVYLINYVFKGGPPPGENCCP